MRLSTCIPVFVYIQERKYFILNNFMTKIRFGHLVDSKIAEGGAPDEK